MALSETDGCDKGIEKVVELPMSTACVPPPVGAASEQQQQYEGVLDPHTTKITATLQWTSATKTDLDLQCCVFDSMGLMLDACYFNNAAALDGALLLSGDVVDAVGRAAEVMTVSLDKLPPHTYAVVFGIYAAKGHTFAAAETATFQICGGECSQLANVFLGDLGAQNTAAICTVLKRNDANGRWCITPMRSVFGPPAHTFVDTFDAMQNLLAIDPALREELRKRQPVFNVVKGGQCAVPYGMKKVALGLGWDAGCDVDAGCIALAADGSEVCIVYYGKLQALDGAISHSGDNLTGVGEGDDEVITVDLTTLPLTVTDLFFCVNVFSSGKSFADVKNEFCRLIDRSEGSLNYNKEMIRFNSLDNGDYNGVVLIRMMRCPHCPQKWTFEAVAQPGMGNTCHLLKDKCVAMQYRKNFCLTIEKAEKLKAMDFGGTSDPYVVVERSGAQIHKTKVIDKNVNPVWNESMELSLAAKEVIGFRVFDKDKILKDEVIGYTCWEVPDAEALRRVQKGQRYTCVQDVVGVTRGHVHGQLFFNLVVL